MAVSRQLHEHTLSFNITVKVVYAPFPLYTPVSYTMAHCPLILAGQRAESKRRVWSTNLLLFVPRSQKSQELSHMTE